MYDSNDINQYFPQRNLSMQMSNRSISGIPSRRYSKRRRKPIYAATLDAAAVVVATAAVEVVVAIALLVAAAAIHQITKDVREFTTCRCRPWAKMTTN